MSSKNLFEHFLTVAYFSPASFATVRFKPGKYLLFPSSIIFLRPQNNIMQLINNKYHSCYDFQCTSARRSYNFMLNKTVDMKLRAQLPDCYTSKTKINVPYCHKLCDSLVICNVKISLQKAVWIIGSISCLFFVCSRFTTVFRASSSLRQNSSAFTRRNFCKLAMPGRSVVTCSTIGASKTIKVS